jgi:putative heme transporter
VSRWRWLGAAILAAFVVVFIWANRHEVPTMWHVLRAARPLWVVGAAAGMVAWIVNDTALHRATLRATGVRLPVGNVAVGAAVAHFLNLTTKSAGMAGMAALRAEARRAGLPERSVTAGYVLAGMLTEMGFSVALIASFAVLTADGHLTIAELLGAIAFAFYAGSRIMMLVHATRNRERLRALFRLPARVIARIRRRRGPSDSSGSDAAADELFDSMQAVRGDPSVLAPAILHALLTEAIAVAILWTSVHAVGASLGPLQSLVAYSVAGLFGIIGFLPGGLGFVEVSLSAVLVSFGIAGATATAGVLLFRVFELWLPVLIGGSLAHRLRVVRR